MLESRVTNPIFDAYFGELCLGTPVKNEVLPGDLFRCDFAGGHWHDEFQEVGINHRYTSEGGFGSTGGRL
jgi:hypothetical protein